MRKIVFILLISAFSAWAKVQEIGGVTLVTEPTGELAQRVLKLDASDPNVILLENKSTQDLWLVNKTLKTKLNPKQWAALQLERGPFLLRCIESHQRGEQVVDCAHVIKSHRLLKIKFEDKATRWLAENQTLDQLLDTLQTHGINFE